MTKGVEDGMGDTCKYCNLPIRETHQGRVRNEWEHMNGLSFCADGKNWAWPVESPEQPSMSTGDAAALRDSLWRLSNEASGFLAMADRNTHGNTNMAVLKSRIDDARALLETIPATHSLPPEMEPLMGAVKTMVLWCPRGWSIELDLAMTATRKALDHIEGKGNRDGI